jgi:PhnB protein
MKPLVPYLTFAGNCREALDFYKHCFGGKTELHTFRDAPKEACPSGAEDKIMHGMLSQGDFTIMASDDPMGGSHQGNNIQLSVHCETMEEIRKLFKALGEGGKVIMPLADTFWNAHFGMIADKFGIHWMLNHPLQK